mgnify:CR=1 FL=1
MRNYQEKDSDSALPAELTGTKFPQYRRLRQNVIIITAVVALVSIGSAVEADIDDQFSSLGADTLTIQPGTSPVSGAIGEDGGEHCAVAAGPEGSLHYVYYRQSDGNLIYGMQSLVAQQIDAFVKFPPRHKPASFNLEAVLRLQAPPLPEEGGGGGGAAAALLTMESDEPMEVVQEVDGREELAEFELEGS